MRSAGRSIFEILHADVKLVSFDHDRALIRSVEESNGAAAWRLTDSRYAPDTQNRRYTLMQKIMMPEKPWCDHAEGFESGVEPGSWMWENGNVLQELLLRMQSNTH